MRATLICESKDSYLEYSYKLYWFRKTVVIVSSLVLMTLSAAGTWLSFQHEFLPIELTLSPVKQLSLPLSPQDICANIEALWIFWMLVTVIHGLYN